MSLADLALKIGDNARAMNRRLSLSELELPETLNVAEAGSTLPNEWVWPNQALPSAENADDLPTQPQDVLDLPAAPRTEHAGVGAGMASVELPISAEASFTAPRAHASHYPVGGPRIKRVLMVDDDLTARLYLRAKLILRGNVQVQEASSAAQAIALAQAQDFDAVLLDVDLGDQNGYEVCKALRQHVRSSHGVQPRICFITSRNSIMDKMRAKLCGADAFLSKPPHPNELAKLLAQL